MESQSTAAVWICSDTIANRNDSQEQQQQQQEARTERGKTRFKNKLVFEAFFNIPVLRGAAVVGFFPRHHPKLVQSLNLRLQGQVLSSRPKSSVFQPLKSARIMDRRTSQNSSGSPLRISPSSSLGGLTNGERKKPFLIGVAGGTASGKVV